MVNSLIALNLIIVTGPNQLIIYLTAEIVIVRFVCLFLMNDVLVLRFFLIFSMCLELLQFCFGLTLGLIKN